jgi:antitoxin component YwqK of YwqJK toxin-antitoxin module
MARHHFLSTQMLTLGTSLFLFSSCVSQNNNPKDSPGTKNSFDSCSIAKPFENIGMTESFVNTDYTGVLNNYWGKDTTKLDFQHYFEHGKLIKSLFYYENGKVQEEYSYKCGSLNGLLKYFYENGKLSQVIPYSYGYRQGIGESYYENGTLLQQATFVRDSLIGEPKSFDEKGNLITQEKK